ncbi:Sec61beta family-domain-containing protein [Tuber indicum]|nr:Sec61beta family-domain-containing protein [Tuber indicum]
MCPLQRSKPLLRPTTTTANSFPHHIPAHKLSSTHFLTILQSSSPRATSPTGAASGSEGGTRSSRPSSPTPPGGPKTAIRRRNAADRAAQAANARPASTRAAGAGGSSSTMLKLYTDESPGLKVDPVIVLVLSLGFIFSVVAMHVIAKISRKWAA